jgi:hypothetical protein
MWGHTRKQTARQLGFGACNCCLRDTLLRTIQVSDFFPLENVGE